MTETVQLGDLVKLRKGRKAQDVHDCLVNGSKPYIQIDEVRGAPPTRFASDPKGVEVTSSDICIVWDGANAGTVGFGIEGLIGSTVARMRLAHGEDWDTGYIGRLLQSKFAELNQYAQARGATIPHVDKARLEAITLPVLSRDEQGRIAAILDKAEYIHQKRERSVSVAETLYQSVFREFFGDPASNPMNWPVENMETLGDVQGGLQVSRRREQHALKTPYLRVANVFRDTLDLTEIKEIGLTEQELQRTVLQEGDVLIVEGHGNPLELGRAAVWDGSIAGCVHQNHLIRFRADRSKTLPEYVSRMLNSTGGRRQLISAGRTTSGLNTISTKKVKAVQVPVPPIELQQKYDLFVTRHKDIVANMSRDATEAQCLFESISQRAFRGEL